MRFAKILAGAAVLALACAPFLVSTAFSADPPQRVGAVLTPAQRLADIAAFRENFLAKDKSYAPAARAEAERRLAVLQSKAADVTQPYFELELARIVALADNGHTHYVLNSISRYYARVPIRLGVFGQDFYVLRATEENADLLGARLVAIDGHQVDQLRGAARDLWGGPAPYRDRFAFELLESPELLNALNLAQAKERATYRFATPAGRVVERALSGDPPSAARPFSTPAQTMFPERLPLEDDHWRTALTRDKAPWSLRAAPIPFRLRPAPEINGLVIELRRNYDGNGFKIAQALAQFDAAIAAQKPTNLVVDLRINDGGDLRTTRKFMQSLPGKVPGRIFVVTSPLTFSAAIASVAYLKQAAPARVSIVGESVGDRLMFFAEGRGTSLPNTAGMIGLATQRHDYAGGCRAYKDCEEAIVHDPISVPSLAPDIPAPWTIQAYLAGRDPAMEAIAAALR